MCACVCCVCACVCVCVCACVYVHGAAPEGTASPVRVAEEAHRCVRVCGVCVRVCLWRFSRRESMCMFMFVPVCLRFNVCV